MKVQKEKVKRKVICRKCKSDQVIGNKRGYSFKRVAIVLFCLFVFYEVISLINVSLAGENMFIAFSMVILFWFSIPLALISGIIGRKNIINGCMNCGHTWMPKK
ncbi:hypothetical protein [Bacillus thuringiensis]|uniref:Uncharacterized protein n=1 Tax=Bacillus thuringiensis TaxID=1428 RepID=B0FXS0_BACTU|nr:hypothetical protein [Bacillus thuringiensis]ABY68469.1 hypothetical protein pFR12_11 [Bacillus thuringiensis]PFE98787.1 hypothetical protein CN325_10745 [Bacillus thuringiensis]PFW14226.1 hypothetical protein COL22_06810 [Bacillus thuringiensis]HDR4897576.1 hypothetical protein [Bacillus cereus]